MLAQVLNEMLGLPPYSPNRPNALVEAELPVDDDEIVAEQEQFDFEAFEYSHADSAHSIASYKATTTRRPLRRRSVPTGPFSTTAASGWSTPRRVT